MNTSKAISTLISDPSLDLIAVWTLLTDKANEVLDPSNKSSNGSNTWKSPTVHPEKLSVYVSCISISNCLNVPEVGIPEIPPTSTVNISPSP